VAPGIPQSRQNSGTKISESIFYDKGSLEDLQDFALLRIQAGFEAVPSAHGHRSVRDVQKTETRSGFRMKFKNRILILSLFRLAETSMSFSFNFLLWLTG
jgi:hypothetical protein